MYAALLAGIPNMHYHAQLFVEMGFPEFFAPSGLEPRSSEYLPPQ
jgi:hypothetical protein